MGENASVLNDTDLIDSIPENGLETQWRIPIGAGYSGPSVVGERLFITDRTVPEAEPGEGETKPGEIPGGERFRCINANSGEVIWKHEYDCPYKIAFPVGPRCTPTVDGEHVYSLGAMGDLICFQVADGKIVWQKKLCEEYDTKPPLWGFSSHPFVDGDKLLVPVGGEGTGVVAFNKMTGEEIWRSVTTMDVAYAPLVMYEADDERQLIFWHADGVTSLDPEKGTEYWTVKFPEETNASQTSIATPRIFGDKIFISEFYKGSLLLQVGSNPPSVKELSRSFKTDPRHERSLNSMITTPMIKDGHAYGIAFKRMDGILRCVEIESGEMKWTKEDWLEEGEKAEVFASAFIVENQDRYFIFTDHGDFVIAQFSPEGYEEIGRANVLKPTGVAARRKSKVIWAHPAFANGKMFARNDEELVCVDLRKK
jgi:outer membrane protein assembly factor BamB